MTLLRSQRFSQLFIAVTLLICAACRPPVKAETTTAQSAWGEITTLGETAAAEAPDLSLEQNAMLASWTQTRERGVEQIIYRQSFDDPSPEQAGLPLGVRSPYDVQFTSGVEDYMHLLWLDERSGLQSALINDALAVERGPALVANAPVFHYDTLLNMDYSLSVVWSSGLPAEPTLHYRMVDAGGRPQIVSSVIAHGDWPALVRTSDDRTWLFWLNPQQQMVYRGEFSGEALTGITPLVASVPLEQGDFIADFSVGMDADYGYLLWNVARINNGVETWIASGELNSDSWAAPVRLGVGTNSDEIFVTGFNGGSAQASASGRNWLGWSSLLAGQHHNLVIATQVVDALGIVYMHDGEVKGYQRIVTLENHGLLGQPAIYSDADRHLYLTWSQPTDDEFAQLRFTSTR